MRNGKRGRPEMSTDSNPNQNPPVATPPAEPNKGPLNLIEFSTDAITGRPSIINYNLPHTTRFDGRLFIDLKLPRTYFDEITALHAVTEEEKLLLSELEVKRLRAETAARQQRNFREFLQHLDEDYLDYLHQFSTDLKQLPKLLGIYQKYFQDALSTLELTLNDFRPFDAFSVGQTTNSAITYIKDVLLPLLPAIETAVAAIPFEINDIASFRITLFSIKDKTNDLIGKITQYVPESAKLGQIGKILGLDPLTVINYFISKLATPADVLTCYVDETLDYLNNLNLNPIEKYIPSFNEWKKVGEPILAPDFSFQKLRKPDPLIKPEPRTTGKPAPPKTPLSALNPSNPASPISPQNLLNPTSPTSLTNPFNWFPIPGGAAIFSGLGKLFGVRAVTLKDGGKGASFLAKMPSALRRIAVARLFPDIQPTNVPQIQSKLKDKNDTNRVFITTHFPDGTSATGRPSETDVQKWQDAGFEPRLVQAMNGEYNIEFFPPDPFSEVEPSIMLVMKCSISNFLGDYGAGATVQTFSLLPGERTKITIKTYTRTETTTQEASSIFESNSASATNSFEASLQMERSLSTAIDTKMNSKLNGNTKTSWGVAEVNLKFGLEVGLNAGMKTFAKAVSNTSQKHTSEKSSKRDITITKSRETTEEKVKEEGLEREIYNPNLSHVLNFVFRQLNQEYLTILHLTDIRVAFSNKLPDDYMEVALPDLDSLLDKYISKKYMLNTDYDLTEERQKEKLDEEEDATEHKTEPSEQSKTSITPEQKTLTLTPIRYRSRIGADAIQPAPPVSVTTPGAMAQADRQLADKIAQQIEDLKMTKEARKLADEEQKLLDAEIAKSDKPQGTDTGGQDGPRDGTPRYRKYVKDKIIKSIKYISDYRNRPFDVLEEVKSATNTTESTGRYRFKNLLYKQFCTDEITHGADPAKFTDVILQGKDHGVEGIVLAWDRVVLRTDALIVEALLGRGMALDNFALGIQDATLEEKQLENKRLQLALDIIQQKNMTVEQAKLAADLYYKMFGLTPMKQFAERTYPVIFPELKKTIQNLSVE